MVREMDESVLVECSSNEVVSVVDFWAPWCKPCVATMPHYEELSQEMDVDFYKVNVNNRADIAMAFGVLSVPTILVLKGTEKVGTIEGALPKNKLKERITEIIRSI